ncbi:DsbA family protein [uncultured Corynebacterium sp.]|uniref:DsbA family protein n=1 Tax=uncultured Corynebacterium sp. TaxID=159447 RepID=UPI0025E4C546|nr:DsbA family protein [uncultured Corynebacterium sp.]
MANRNPNAENNASAKPIEEGHAHADVAAGHNSGTANHNPGSDKAVGKTAGKTAGKAKGMPVAAALVGALIIGAAASAGGYALGKQHGREQAQQEAIAAKIPPAGANGTRGEGPKALPDGTYNAAIVGPGKKIESDKDILNVHRRNAEDPFAIGAVDAPVVISEFADMECPYCATFHNETRDKIVQNYVDKGLVRLEWNDFAINGEHAVEGAKAGRAAAKQGKFQEFMNELYKASKGKQGHPGFKKQDFEKFAEAAGVPDMEKFKKDATGKEFDKPVAEARQYGASIGINGTPAFVVGTKFVSGAQPWDVFKKVIDEELERVASGEVPAPAPQAE